MYTEWPIDISTSSWVSLAAFALEPVQVDSIIILHRGSPDGPTRLRVSYANNAMEIFDQVSEVDITQDYQESVFVDLGCLYIPTDGGLPTLQLKLQAFQGGSGNWQLDNIRIVVSPCNFSTTIGENLQRDLNSSVSYIDVLGRDVSSEPAPGVYIGKKRTIQIF